MPINPETELSICYSISNFHPNGGGAEQFALNLAVYASEHGSDVTVVTRAVPGCVRESRFYGVRVFRDIHTLNAGPLFGVTYLLTSLLAFFPRVLKADILYSHFLYLDAVIMAFYARLFRKPLVIQLHSSGACGDIAALKDIHGGKLLMRFLLRSGRFIAISEDIRRELIAEGCEDARIIPISVGVDTEKFRPPEDREALRRRLGFEGFSVVYMGRLAPQKGLLHLLLACVPLAKREGFRLYIIGRGPQEAELKSKAAELGLADTVVFTGHVPDTVPYLQAADVYVLPSIAEGMPASLMEAMACGTACVASDIGGVRELVSSGRNGLLVRPASSDALAEALGSLCSNPALRMALASNARAVVGSEHDEKTVFSRHCLLYAQLVSRTFSPEEFRSESKGNTCR